MNSFVKKILIVTGFILAAINGLIFLKRDAGFEYRRTVSTQAPAPYDSKWDHPADFFGEVNLKKAYQLLQQNIAIDTIHNEEGKMIAIGEWLIEKFATCKKGLGDSAKGLTAMDQYNGYVNKKFEEYDCGNMQPVYALFLTAANLKNRHIQFVQFPNKNIPDDGHVANEVFLHQYNKWVYSDPYMNELVVKKNDTPISVTTYLDFMLKNESTQVAITVVKNNQQQTDTVSLSKKAHSVYINENYYINFFLPSQMINPYSISKRITRYLYPNPWHEVYSPQQPIHNTLFRIKQLMLVLLALWFIFVLVTLLKKHFD